MKQEFKDRWVKSLREGKYKRRRYGLSDGNNGRCVMGAARSCAVDMGILKEEDLTGRDLLNNQELQAIGISEDTQFLLSTMNDTYVATSKDKFPMRMINVIEALPTREKVPLLIDYTKE